MCQHPVRLAIDFGTTNSVIAASTGQPGSSTILALPGLSYSSTDGASLIPSLVYLHNGRQATATVGQAVRETGLGQQADNRLFRNFKRSITAAERETFRLVDDSEWSDHRAGRHFIHAMLDALPYSLDDVEQLVLTALR